MPSIIKVSGLFCSQKKCNLNSIYYDILMRLIAEYGSCSAVKKTMKYNKYFIDFRENI